MRSKGTRTSYRNLEEDLEKEQSGAPPGKTKPRLSSPQPTQTTPLGFTFEA
jgi:hypothetical protein